MSSLGLKKLDLAAAVLLLLWVGMALGIAVLAAPSVFKAVPRTEAGLAMGRVFQGLDWSAWGAFLGALALIGLPRWAGEISDGEVPVGPFRLWVAAALAGLLMCMASTFVITPKIESRRAALATLPEDHPERAAFRKAHAISSQMLIIRMLLGLGLACTVGFLPRQKPTP